MLRTFSPLLLLALALVGCGPGAPSVEEIPASDLTQFVNPFIGTGGHGHTFPGATRPFGMVQLSPDTRLEGWDGCSGYHYTDSVVYGFSHTHLSGTGVADYCDILFKPCVGSWRTNNGYESHPDSGYASFFSKASETAAPGYYRMALNEGIGVELTATERVGMHRYTFHEAENAHVVLDLFHRDQLLDAGLELVDDRTIRGFRRSKSWAQDQVVYFVAQFSKPMQDHLIEGDSLLYDNSPYSASQEAKAIINFDLNPGDTLLLKVGLSAVDWEGARKNLEAELPHWDFDRVRQEAEDTWNVELNKIRLDSPDEAEKTIFYSALYHTMIAPNLFSDVDGRYRKALPKAKEDREGMAPIGQLEDGQQQYTIFSLWDTYRATHPLYTIIDQERTNAYIQTFLRQYQDGGQLPVWELACNYTGCMIGYHSVSVMADAYVKGIRDYDAQLALEAMRHSAGMSHLGLDALVEHGYIPSGEEPESVSKTLEYAYDDWCIATMAEAIGDKETHQVYSQRAQYYKNLFNPENGFLMGRANGGWHGPLPFRPEEVNFNYTEANGWQYSLAAPHDITG
ncbi:MAG: GH92 family glycosyl hydrolase, partial [Bacteroidota bacterium]